MTNWQKIRDEIAALEVDGGVTASRVVEMARDPSTESHKEFDWNDETAAHEYRLMKARQLIRAVVRVTEQSVEAVSVYVHVPSASRGEGVYRRMDVIAARPNELQSAINEAQSDLAAARRRVQELAGLGARQSVTNRALRSIADAQAALVGAT